MKKYFVTLQSTQKVTKYCNEVLILRYSPDYYYYYYYYYYLAPGRGRGIVFGRFLSFFVSLSATLRENGWIDLHEIFREGVERPWNDLIKFWVNSNKRVGGSKVIFLLSPAIAQRIGVNKSVSFARWQQGRGLLCLAPQLVIIIIIIVIIITINLPPDNGRSRLSDGGTRHAD